MNTSINSKAQVALPSDTEVQVTRDFKAPRELVWQAHVDPELFQRWIGGYPGWSMPVCEMDVRVGGKFRIDMHGKDGKIFKHNGEYLEVLPPRRLKFTWISAATNQLPTVVTIDFKALGDQTEITLVHDGLDTSKNVEGHTKGWTEILEQLRVLE